MEQEETQGINEEEMEIDKQTERKIDGDRRTERERETENKQ